MTMDPNPDDKLPPGMMVTLPMPSQSASALIVTNELLPMVVLSAPVTGTAIIMLPEACTSSDGNASDAVLLKVTVETGLPNAQRRILVAAPV